MSVQVRSYTDMDESERRVFETYMKQYHPIVSREPADAAVNGKTPGEVRDTWDTWDDIARRDLPDDVAEDVLDAFYVRATVQAASQYADVHLAHAFGEYMRNRDDIADSRNLPYVSHDRSELSNEDRMTILDYLTDGYDADEIVDEIGTSERSVEALVTDYWTQKQD